MMMVTKDNTKNPINLLKEAYKRKPAITIGLSAVLVLVIWGAISLLGGEDATSDISPYVVKTGPLRISISETGSITPKEKIIVKNEVEGETTIVYIVDEGADVKKGDLLVELDSSTLTDEQVDQEIQVLSAEASYIDARENLSVTKSQAESDVDEAELTYEFAKQDLQKYIEGEYPNQLKEAEANITLSEEELAEAEETLEWSKKLYEEQFVSASELESDELAYKKKELDLDLAKRDLELLVNYTHKRELAQLESDVKQAQMSLDRTERSTRADVVQAEANFKAKEAEYTRQQDKLKKIEAQLEKTKIYAPADGSVIYATSAEQMGSRFGSSSEPLELGSSVRERQELIHLPTNTGYMTELSIAEASIDKIRKGLPAIITIDTLPGKVFTGKVQYVSSVVDAQSAFMNPDLKVYDTEVVLDNDQDLSMIRSGMSCTAEIVVAQYEEATYIPVQAVQNVSGNPTVYVVNGKDLEPTLVDTGKDNGIVIKIDSGLETGDIVALNPPMQEAASSEQSYEQLSDDVVVADQDSEESGGDQRAASGNDGNSQQSGGPSGSGGNFMTNLDTDGDGQISESEFQGPDNMFSTLDKDGNGYITDDEMPTGRPSGGNSGSDSEQGQMPSGGQQGQMPSGGMPSGFPTQGSSNSSQGGQMMQGATSGQMGGFGAAGGAR
jgi:HlyD family secretion protein